MATVTELVTKFAFAGSTKPLEGYNKNLATSVKLLASFSTAALATGAVIAAWATDILRGVDSLNDLAIETSSTVAQIQEMDFAAQQLGSNAEAMNGTLRGLSVSAGLAAKGMGRGKEVFKELGISVKDANGHVKSATVLLDEIRRKMNALNMSTEERRGLATRLGIDGSLVQYLSQTDSAMQKLIVRARELGTLTQEQAAAAADYNDALDAMEYAMNSVKQQVAVGLAPVMKDLAETVTDLIANNKEWVVKGIKVTMEFITQLLAVLTRVAPVLAVVGVAFAGAKLYMMGWAAIVAAVTSPVVLITAGLTALILVVDDLIVAFEGGDSVIGNFAKNVAGFDMSKVLGEMKELWEWITKISAALTGNIASFLGLPGADIDVIDPAMKLGGRGNERPTDSATGLPKPSPATTGTLDRAITTGQGKGSTTNNTDNRKIEQKVQIDVHAADPVAAGNAAADGVQRQLKDANAQLGTGGL